MNYRFLKISRYYTNYIEYFRRTNRYIELEYEEMLNKYLNDYYIYGNAYSKYLGNMGNETYEIIFNDNKLQRKWAIENGMKNNCSLTEILFKQIKDIAPEVIFWDGFEDYEFVNYVKENIESVKIIFSQIGVPIINMNRFKPYDFVITCLPSLKIVLEKNGIDSYFIRHGFDARIINELNNVRKIINLSFIGSIYSGLGAHYERAECIKFLAENTDIEIYSGFKNPTINDETKYLLKKSIVSMFSLYPSILTNKNSSLSNRIIHWKQEAKKIQLGKGIIDKFKDPVYGLDMFKILSESKISLNVHIDVAGNYAASIRMYEVTGVGTCLLTDFKENIKEYFEPDYEIVTFKSPEEALEKYNFLINNPVKMKDIARNGQKRTLKEHTMEKRIEELDLVIRKYLSK